MNRRQADLAIVSQIGVNTVTKVKFCSNLKEYA